MKIKIEGKLCKGCGYCIEVCPKEIFIETAHLNEKGYTQPEIINPETCIFCRKCELICPEMAINIEKEGEK
ncbi:MAG: 4Fe-4S dicluster domain-containing protein [Candidatus Helarchaeota archaeon]